MLRRAGCAMSTIFAAQVGLALFGSAPILARSIQTTASVPGSPPAATPQPKTADAIAQASSTLATAPQPNPPPSAEEPTASSAAGALQSPGPTTPSAPTSPASAVAQPPASAPSPPPAATAAPSVTPATAEAPPAAPPIDPVLAEVRRQLAEPAKGNVDRGDRAQLTGFYAERNEPPLWVSAGGFIAKANHLMVEIRRADDWGLSASGFELPHLPSGTAAVEALAAAEIKLGLAALNYARHAR